MLDAVMVMGDTGLQRVQTLLVRLIACALGSAQLVVQSV
ncbi:hypothetical protein SynWH8103_00489 [Synechococcus sp. WH 8103]|nr:hypothetical protein SynWH8103_00489 [Synechococcus sp. WH 8103]